jgi:hypothetical protein
MMETPPKGEGFRVLVPAFTPENLSLTALRVQVIAARYALPIETAAIVAALVFGGNCHG